MSRGPFEPDPVPSEDLPVAVRELRVGQSARRAFIVDNLVAPEALVPLHMAYRRMPYTFGDMDRVDTEFARHLVHYFQEDEYETDPAVSSLLAQARAFMDDQGLDYKSVQRIYANFNLFGDFQFAHPDGEDSWTALFFINSCWNEDWGGEFLMYEDGPQAIALAVAPKPGRMVLFDGEIIHRGGSPSKYCLDARITVAIKFDRV
jgi:SM-20-related protein